MTFLSFKNIVANPCSARNVWGALLSQFFWTSHCITIVDCWSSVSIVNHRSPYLHLQQNADLGWIDKIVDCWSSVSTINCQLPYIPPINKMRIWSGLTKLILCVNRQQPPPGTLHFLQPSNFKYIDWYQRMYVSVRLCACLSVHTFQPTNWWQDRQNDTHTHTHTHWCQYF